MKFFTAQEKAEYQRLCAEQKKGTLTERQDHAREAYKTVIANYVTVVASIIVFTIMFIAANMRGSGAIAFMAVLFCISAIYNSLHTAKMYYKYWAGYFEEINRQRRFK